jgi:hypothetical protein
VVRWVQEMASSVDPQGACSGLGGWEGEGEGEEMLVFVVASAALLHS